ncbi:DNA-binding transcriptional regulator, GntR family [Monaibacterium marinum]|uniref:DNA-binding transcriptional regulator, GntR family n=1 Tax=Pontivivens marinum TaxID=1690039 RepID=A0A2C9CR92_9RHOB|nr:GntR family transcriptional regulator [Monaibacterium marinum]SOH93864.1 DNA-binding transcriptional regulator, GntR family [Monaibacterium marinum]
MPDTPLLTPKQKSSQTTTDQVFTSLCEAVISLQLPPGTKVSEVEIAKQFDVSRQPVRDAFFRLSKLGFLSIRPQRATLITHISIQAVRDAIFVRSALEGECAVLACENRNSDDLQRLRATMDEQQTASSAADAHSFHANDDAFHECLCNISGHGHVWPLIQEQKAHMDRVRYISLSAERRVQVMQEHDEIITAIEHHDTQQARTLTRNHICSVLDVLDAIRSTYTDYFEPSQT